MALRTLFLALMSMAALSGAARAAPAPAETTGDMVRVGDLDGGFIHPYDNVWVYSATFPDGRTATVGLWSDHLQATKVDGKDAWVRVQGLTLIDGRGLSNVNTFDPRTLEAYASTSRRPDGALLHRDFKGGHVISKRTPAKGEAATVEFDAPAPVFDFNGGMYGMVLAAMPLREGLSGSFPTVEEFEDKPAVDHFRVLRQEDIKAGSHGVVRAWVVESERPGQYKMTFWLTKTAPYIIRLVYTTSAKGSPVYAWDMI